MTRSAHWPEATNKYDSLDRHSTTSKTPYTNGEPLPTSTALVPAPDSLISPSIAASLPFYSNSLLHKSSDIIEEDVELCPAKLETIKTKINAKEGRRLRSKCGIEFCPINVIAIYCNGKPF